jgi:hypothetical protein
LGNGKKHIILWTLLLGATASMAQQVNLENAMSSFREKVKAGKKLKISGGISANTTYSKSTVGGMRDPFVYAINGNLNLSFMNISIPVSMNLTNAGFSYSYQYPRLPSRLSIHPKYKSVQAHIGDFSMNFSPYTMSGFQVFGGGIDFQPKGKWKYSAFYGRFQKAVPYQPGNGNTIATYKRMGGGFKVSNDKEKIQTALSVIRIQDMEKSLPVKPDSLNVFPKANLAIGFENKLKLNKYLQLQVEYGLSFLTNDVRARQDSAPAKTLRLINSISRTNASTNIYHAIKSGLTYSLGSSNIGIGYERIDPGYQTLGAYYFNNDLENITMNFAQQLFKNKFNLNLSVGMQKDDLRREKTGQNRRFVSSINASINPSQKFTSSVSYSNFQTFTNVKPQFQFINQLTPYENLDTLNFRQLSQNANVNVNYILRADKEKSRILNATVTFQDSYDEQGGVIAKGNASQMYNLAINYTSVKVPVQSNFAYGLNMTYNTIGTNNTITAGPTFSYGKAFFDKKVRTNFAAAYNMSMLQQKVQQQVVSARMSASYTMFKKHQLALNGVYMHRKLQGKPGQDASVTFTYSYSF